MKYRFLALCGSVLLSLCVFAQNEVTVHINSGNPRFPFPQFLAYEYGDSHYLDNLGTKNPEGVVHAEMEQDIRDAYQIFANEWTYTGDRVSGVRYIRGNLGCPYDCREGDGYSLLAAAIMADKTSFDGLWMCVHDKSRVKQPRYIDGVVLENGYQYGDFSLKDNQDAATDGDVDIALALYVAWMQWGDYMGVNDSRGNPISYKKELMDVLKGFMHLQTRFPSDGEPRRYLSGEIGLDGYLKNGNTWSEATNYVTQNPMTVDGVRMTPEFAGPCNVHTDYLAPAYFREFYELLEKEQPSDVSEFERNQFKRCEASCDWMVGNWISQNAKNIFVGEEAKVNGTSITLMAGNQGGRFRSVWRTALNYVWHGNPSYTWDPASHTVKDGANTYEYDGAVRYSQFMNDPQGWNNSNCTKFGGGPKVTYKGPGTLHWDIEPNGGFPSSEFIFNWIAGCGTMSALSAEDLELLGVLYRTCVIEWDITTGGDGYLSSVPHYFHGWFRLLGMLTATGNHIAPSKMLPKANMKIYRAVQDSLSFAYTGDVFSYILDYRNYGSVDAENVKIVEHVPDDFIFVSAEKGGVYDAVTHTVTWNLGTVPGFQTGGLDVTKGSVSYSVKVGPKAAGRYCTTAEISCSNGFGWTSNEYPNYITPTMQRNCVDVIMRSLIIEKEANLEETNPNGTVTYTINFENSSKAGWLDGGRPRVNIAFSNTLDGSQNWLRFRLYNDAIEPYINYGNYRISYYLYDASLKCLSGEPDCSAGWAWYTAVYEGKRTSNDKVSVSHEKVVEGSDDYGKWNQRMIIQFAPLLVTITGHLSNYYGMGSRIHRGGTEPLRLFGYLYPSDWSTPNYRDDWSWNSNATGAEDGAYFPVTPSWQRIDQVTGKSIETPVNEYIPSVCDVPPHTIPNILVEEYDGYVWRRILGTGPMAGRDMYNVVVCDTLPKGLTFVEFKTACPLAAFGANMTTKKASDGRDIVVWTIPAMQIKQKGTIKYTAVAKFPSGKSCQTDDEIIDNVAWIYADMNSPVGDTATITVTCAKVPEPIIPTTLTKTPDSKIVSVGDEITYTLEYEQTHGFITDNAGQNSSDWSGGSVSNGTVSVATNTTATYSLSKSKDIYVEATCNLASYASIYMFFRDNVRLWLKVDNGLLLNCENNSSNKMLANDAKILGVSSPFRIAVELRNNIMRVWVGGSSVDTSESAAVTFENISTAQGNFGFKNSDWGSHSFSKIHVHTDNAYNLSIVDELPSELTYVSSSNSGAKSGDKITWTFEQGLNNPIPFGKKYKVTVTAKVNSCNGKIINEAHVNLLGHAENEIRAQAIVECGNNMPDPPIVDDVTYCQGDDADELTAVGDNLQWYASNKTTKLASAPTPSTTDAGTTTYYVTQTVDGVESSKAPLSVVVNPKPSKPTISANSPVCAGEELTISTLSMQNATYKWTGPNGFTSTNVGNTISSASVSDAGEYSVVVTSEFGCVSDEATKDVVVNPVPDKPEAKTSILYCKGQTAETLTATGTNLQWYSSTSTVLTEAPTPATNVVKDVTYYVSQTIDGCESELLEIQVSTVDKPSTPDINGVGVLCEGETLSLSTDMDGSYEWTGPNGFTATDQNLEINNVATGNAGSYSLVVTVGTCKSDEATKTVTVNKIPDTPSPSNNGPKCVGDVVTLTTSSVTNASYTWTAPDGTMSYDQNKAVTEAGTYSLRVTVAGCTSEAETTEVVLYEHPEKPTVEEVKYCQGETASVLTAEGTNLKWYLNATGGTGVTTAFTPNTATVGSVPYYVTQTENNCESERAELVVKTLEPPSKPVITTNSPVCAGETITFETQSEGTYSWTGPNSFTSDEKNPEIGVAVAGSAGDYSLIVKVGNCTSEAGKATVVVNPVPEVTIDPVANLCVDGNPVSLTVTAVPSGGTGSFSGTGVSGTTFDPATAGVGTHEVSYTYEVNGCSTTESINVVVQDKPTVSFDLPETTCASSDVIALVGNQTGGTFTAVPNIDLSAGFIPANATVKQEYTITYEYSDGVCSNSTSNKITVYDPQKPVGVDAAEVYTKVSSGTVPELSATGVNMIWYSDEALTTQVQTGDSYTPSETVVLDGDQGRIGTYTYYVVSTEEGCTSEATAVHLEILSCMVKTPKINSASVSVCEGETDPDKRIIDVVTDAYGMVVRWYNTARELKQESSVVWTFDPELSEVGSNVFFVTAYDEDQQCESPFVSVIYSIRKLPTVSFDLPAEVCEGSAEIDFAPLKSQEAGVVMSLWGDQGPETSFLPNKKGQFKFEYSYTDARGCTNSIQKEIKVNELPEVTFNDIPDQCEYNDPVDLSFYAGPIGGTFSGSGVTKQNTFYLFNPAAVTAGTSATITYTYTDGKNCTNSAQKAIQVIARPSVSFNDVPSLCVGDEKHDLLQYVSPTIGSFTGDKVSVTEFNPETKGDFVVSYTVEEDGCSAMVNKTVVVNALPTVSIETNAVACVNTGDANLQLIPSGGTFTIDDEAATAINTNELTVGNHTLHYIYVDQTTKCVNEDTKQVEVREIEKPEVSDKEVVIGSTNLTITAIGHGGSLEWTDQNGTKTTGSTISHPNSSNAGEWEYCVTETDGVCTSEPSCMTFTVFNCTTPRPIVTVEGGHWNEGWADVLVYDVCATDDMPTFHATTTSPDFTLKWYSGVTGQVVNTATPEVFTDQSVKGKVGSYSWNVSQVSAGENGCEGIPVSIRVEVNKNPEITINNDKLHFCEYDDRVKIEVSSGAFDGEFTFSGEAVIDEYFYPTAATTIGTAIPITVDFTDSETGCSTSESSRFYVHHVEPLTVQTPITQLESDYETVLEVTPEGTNKAVWYDACGDGRSQLFVGKSFQTGLVGIASEDYGVTQKDRYGCESECAVIQVDRIKCPTPAPTVYVDRNQICATDEIPIFTASGLEDVMFTWYENGEIVGYDNTFTPSSLKGQAGDYSWTVTQTTIGANGCEGIGAPVTLKIHQSPEIVVTVSDVICMNEGVVVPKSNLDGTQFAFAGARVSVIDPTLYTPDTYKLAYAYYDPVTGCPAVESDNDCYTDDCLYKMIEIREIPKVVVNNTTSLIIAESFPISIASGHGGDYTWTDENGNVIGEGATITHPYEVAVGSWKYCVTESDEVCSSDPACMTFTIIDCPVPAPRIKETNIIGCTNEPMKAMEAEDQGYMVRWYKEDEANTVKMTGLSYTPDDLTNAGVYKYYVTQFDESCEGLPTMVTYELKTTELPIVEGLTTICENEELDLIADDVVSWYTEDPKSSSPVEETDVFTVSYPEANEYTVYVVRTDEYCSSDPLVLNLTVNKIPDQPIVTTTNVCEGNDVEFNAVGTDIKWYQSEFEVEVGETYIVEHVHAGEIAVQATQTIDGCTSPLSDEVVAVVYSIPQRPTAVNRTICEDADIQSVQVQAYCETVTWYSDSELTDVIETGTSYMPKKKETQTFYVVQTENSCTSEPVEVTFTVQPNPEPVRFKQTTDIVSCEGSQVVIITETSNTVYWYDSQDGFPIYTGRFFTVTDTDEGSYVYFAQQKDKFGCTSELSAKKVVFKPAPGVASIVQEDTVCVYEAPGTLIAARNNEDEIISWIAPDGSTIVTGDTLTVPADVINGVAGVYLFRARTTNSTCSYETRKEIPLKYVVFPQPEAPKLKTDYFCYTGEPVKLTAEGENILWYTPEGSMIAGCPYKKECTTYYMEAGTYDVYMTQNVKGCVSDTVANQFLISALPSPYIIGKSQLCANSNEVYVVTKTNESNFIDWQLTGNRVSYDMSNYNTGFVRSIDWIDPGVDTIFVIEKNKYGCMGKTELVVEVIPVPDAQFITEMLGQEGVVTFTNTSEPQILNEGDFTKEYKVDYYWDFGRFADSTNILENKKVFDRMYPYGDYTAELTAVNEFGCSAKYADGFFVNVEHRLYIPSAFAPSCPGNEVRVFKPKGVNCKTFEIWIYDAWNNLVYYSSGVDERGAPNASWDGMVNGKMREAGTYRYKILVTFEDHEEETMRVTQNVKPIYGNVELLR
ncbi:MAG: hypothetical protein IK117_10825 [Bacteroidales bacterium]|nr:hypothetical protein [Bacteroidales bacterium]